MTNDLSIEKLRDINNVSRNLLPTPAEVYAEQPLTPAAAATTFKSREIIKAILDGKDSRYFAVVGPCSIHDLKAALEYARLLKNLADEISDVIVLVMRVYFEKPRTSMGWKGFINDPDLDDSFKIEKGLRLARSLLLDINGMGLPVGTEALDPITPQYLDDLISWTAIGARTVESQTHRELASGLSTPVGFKNGTDGSLQVAINALKAVSHSHHFLGINRQGQCCVFHSTGNNYGHIVLRGGQEPNYGPLHVAACEESLRRAGLRSLVMVDCSHGNSQKDPARQPLILEECVRQIVAGNRSIRAFMFESNLRGGCQELAGSRQILQYGVSITDPCLDFEETRRAFSTAAEELRRLRK